VVVGGDGVGMLPEAGRRRDQASAAHPAARGLVRRLVRWVHAYLNEGASGKATAEATRTKSMDVCSREV